MMLLVAIFFLNLILAAWNIKSGTYYLLPINLGGALLVGIFLVRDY